MEKVRSFIAVELSARAKAELSRVAEEFRKAGGNVKWVAPETIHLTLKFLGPVPGEDLPRIEEALKVIASGFPAFDMTIEGSGSFPSWKFPRVIWVGVGTGADELKDLARQVEDSMALIGFEKEKRPFSPHITLGRVRSPKNKAALRDTAERVKVSPETSRVSGIKLFRSDLSPRGAVHTVLAEIPLK